MCACKVALVMSSSLQATLWTVACQAPLCMGFSRLEYRGELPCPLPGSFQPRNRAHSSHVSCIDRQVLLALESHGKPRCDIYSFLKITVLQTDVYKTAMTDNW